jgi:hypothetical protein
VLLYAKEGNSFESVLVDPWTGALLEGIAEEAADRPPPVPPPSPAQWDAWEDERGGMITSELGVVTDAWRAWTGEVYRTFAWADDALAPVEGPCPNETTRFFVYGTELWSSQVDGSVLSWGRWLPLP